MSSGEVLFILVFIILPTAVLVSAVWALVFIRQSPARIAQQRQLAMDADTLSDHDDDTEQETILFASEELLLDPEPEPITAPDPEPPRPEPVYESEIPQTTEDMSAYTSQTDEPEPSSNHVDDPEQLEEASDVPTSEEPAEDENTGDPPAENGVAERRRKQQAKLIPGDPDTSRNRGRHRDSQRLVPRLSRGPRRQNEG